MSKAKGILLELLSKNKQNLHEMLPLHNDKNNGKQCITNNIFWNLIDNHANCYKPNSILNVGLLMQCHKMSN